MKLFTALLLLLVITACTDPITVGSDLLGEDRATVGETTDLPFTARVVREDSIWVLNGVGPSYVQGPAFSFGEIDDPTFGRTTHSVYLPPRLPRNPAGTTIRPDFATLINLSVDSVVLILPLDTTRGVYGPGREFPYRALEILEPIETVGGNIYSNFAAAVGTTDLGADPTFDVVLSSRLVRDTTITKPGYRQPHVRIRLSDAFANRIENLQPTDYDADTLFREGFAGIYLVPDGPTDGLINIQPIEANNVTPFGGYNVYFTDSSGTATFYRMPLQVSLPRYEYDYDNSLVGTLLADSADADLLAVAGKGGVMTEINFGDLSEYTGRIINRASLELPVASVPGVSYTDYPLPRRLEVFFRPVEDGPLIGIQDKIDLIRTRGNTVNGAFFLRGSLQTEGGASYYSPALSLHLQRIIDGEVPSRIYVRAYPLDAADYGVSDGIPFAPISATDPGRALLNGPESGNNPAYVRVTFTELD